MIALSEVEKTTKNFAKLGLTVEAANWLVKIYNLDDENFSHFELREPAQPSYILLTTNGEIGEKQTVIIPANVFDFPLQLIINLLAHEMLHVKQKSPKQQIQDRNEREFQAYYEMLFHKQFPTIPDASDFHKKFFAEKAYKYYNRMGNDSELQIKYAKQKEEVENLLKNL